jgi:hypothetical protein
MPSVRSPALPCARASRPTATLCGGAAAALAILSLLPALLSSALASAALALCCLALIGTAAAAAVPVWALTAESAIAPHRLAPCRASALVASVGGAAFSAALPLLVPDASPTGGAAGTMAHAQLKPLGPWLLVALLAAAACAALTLSGVMRGPEMVQRLLILSLQSLDSLDDLHAIDDGHESLVGGTCASCGASATWVPSSGAQATCPSCGGSYPPATHAPSVLASSSLDETWDTARDVRQKGSIETMSTLASRPGRPASPPKPYPVDRLVRVQLASGMGVRSGGAQRPQEQPPPDGEAEQSPPAAAPR